MSPVERVVRRIDEYQQSHRWSAFGFGVVKKFGDDRGGALAALMAYYGFLAVFPLLLLLTTVLGYLVGSGSSLGRRILDSALVDFPIIGDQLLTSIRPLRGSGAAVAVGVLGLVWGSLGVTQATQHAMAEVWNIPGVVRPAFVSRLLRGLALLAVLGVGVLVTAGTAALTAMTGASIPSRALAVGASVLVNVGLFVAAYRITTPNQVQTRDLVPGAIVAALAWSVLQAVGGYLIGHNLRHASQVYGFFGSVLGLVSWLFLGAQLTVYAAELNVVRVRKLWPRSIVQPPLTPADQRTLADIARQGERRPEETVEVRFEEPVH